MFVSFVERDGLARSVLVLLVITTLGCVSYSWGYYEGFHNAKVLVKLEEPSTPITTSLSEAADGAAQRKVHTAVPTEQAHAQLKAQAAQAILIPEEAKLTPVPTMKPKRGGRLRQGDPRHRPMQNSQEELALLPNTKGTHAQNSIGMGGKRARKANQKQAKA